MMLLSHRERKRLRNWSDWSGMLSTHSKKPGSIAKLRNFGVQLRNAEYS